MASRRRANYISTLNATNTAFDGLVRLWMLRILVLLKGSKRFIDAAGYDNPFIADYLGLKKSAVFSDGQSEDDLNFDGRKALSSLRRVYAHAEGSTEKHTLPVELENNTNHLARLINLNSTEKKILQFVVVLNTHRMLDDVADYLGALSNGDTQCALAVILGDEEVRVRQALSSSAILAQAGILTFDRNCILNIRGKLDLLSNEFAEKMMSDLQDPMQLLKGTVNKAGASTLTWNEYHHIQSELAILRPYLRRAVATKRIGVNILIHGLAGTGKSELSRLVAQDLGRTLFEVASEDEEGDPLPAERRLRAYRAAQTFFANSASLLVFDEAEDVYSGDGSELFTIKSPAQKRKAWMNRMLEESALPTLWLSNNIVGIDNAFLRRYDMIIELPTPPKEQRKRIIEQACGDMLNPQQLNALASTESLTPAIITRAASVIQLIREDVAVNKLGENVSALVNATLLAQGYAKININPLQQLPEDYDPNFINADCDLHAIAKQLQECKQASLCFYGASGTGKTAFGRWLAEQLGCTLLSKKVSDLVSPYVGMTEKNIAKAFDQAERERAILLIDECDSFLADRRQAKHNWEITQVNEMLTQMESFNGIFIASTNLMSHLDPATLRRFDLKLRFDYLTTTQAMTLFCRMATSFGLGEVETGLLNQIAKMTNLTLGDFATLKRQHRLRPCLSNEQLLQALRDESEIKEDGHKQKIGFV